MLAPGPESAEVGDKAWVCVWDPKHTLVIAEDQEDARGDGLVATLMRKVEKGADKVKLFAERGLLASKMIDGVACCAKCDAPLEELYAPAGVKGRLPTIRAIAEDFDGAIDRTRRYR